MSHTSFPVGNQHRRKAMQTRQKSEIFASEPRFQFSKMAAPLKDHEKISEEDFEVLSTLLVAEESVTLDETPSSTESLASIQCVPETPSPSYSRDSEICGLSPILPLSQSVPDVPTFECEPCGKKFKNRSTMRSHNRRKHEMVFHFLCVICGKKFFNNLLLKEHRSKVHTNTGVCRCKTCGKVLSTYRGMREHVKSHSGEIHSCDECDKVFTSSSHLKRHYTSHSKPVSCDLCDKRFATKQQLNVHSVTHDVQPTIFKCGICSYQSKWYACVKRHATQVHSDSRPHVCDVCGHAFKDKANLKRHTATVKCDFPKSDQQWEDL